MLKYKNQKGITTKEQNNGESSEINNERKIQFKKCEFKSKNKSSLS